MIRRQARAEFDEDATPTQWWQGLALGEFPIIAARLLARAGDVELARATLWDMQWFDRLEGRMRLGLIEMEVPPEHRRKGYARFLLGEVFRYARSRLVQILEVQTAADNARRAGALPGVGLRPDRPGDPLSQAGHGVSGQWSVASSQ